MANTFDWNILINASASVGGLAVVGKWLISSAEKANASFPVILNQLEVLNESAKELFASRNKHEVEIAEIRTGIEYCESCNVHRIQRSGDERRKK